MEDKYSFISDVVGINEDGKQRTFCIEKKWIFDAPKSYKYVTNAERENELISEGFDLSGSEKPLIIRGLKRSDGKYLFELVLSKHYNIFGKEYDMDDLRYDDRADTQTDGVVRHELILDTENFVVDLLAKSIFLFGAEYEIRVRGENIEPYNLTLTILNDIEEDELEKVKKAVNTLAKTIRLVDEVESLSKPNTKSKSKKISISDSNYVINGTVVKKYTANDNVVTIPAGITEIADNAFYGKKLEYVSFPEGLLSIGDNAFASCTNLKAVVLPDTVHELGRRSFENCFSIEYVKLSSSLKCVGDYAFVDAHELSYLEIPEGIETIGNSAFSDCQSLEDLVLPSTIKTLDNFAFKGCNSLAKVILPNGLETIGFTAFAWNRNMTYLYVPKTVKNIYDNFMDQSPFEGCSSLTIYGHSGSEIEKYATSHGISFSAVTSEPKAVLSKVVPPVDSIPNGMNEFIDSVGSYTTNSKRAKARKEKIKNSDIALYEDNESEYYFAEEDRYYVQLDECEMDGDKLIKFTATTDKPCIVFPKGIRVIGDNAITAEAAKAIVFSEGLGEAEMTHNCLFENSNEVEYLYLPSTFKAPPYFHPFWTLNLGYYTSLKYFDVSKDNVNCTSINGVLYDRSQKDRAYLLEAPAAIKEIRITKDVARIREGAFRYCNSIEKIQVEEGNKRYKCIDGMLCELKDDKTHLMLVPTTVSGEFICPKGINVLDSKCFRNLDDITKVVLSEEVERVEDYAFGYHPENLKVIDVPSPSTIIDENAIHFFKDYDVWTVQCMEGSEADKTARKMGWNVDNTPYEEKTRKWREEQELIKLEVERKAREEAERKAREEAERKAREEVERKAREEEERKAKEEAERKEREKEKRKAAREEAKRKAREEAEHKAYEEAQRLEQERIRAERRSKKLCQHCGGTFKGLFTKKCSNCGEKKDY